MAKQNENEFMRLALNDLISERYGDYAKYISKEMAVYGPLGITGGCLTMMFLTRKTVYPWMICMFSMLLPALILITNIFPS